ncbi:MAG: SufE family protein [Bacteroidetes bacterium]|nr:SufE family protein [Bacteroidota bacterium]
MYTVETINKIQDEIVEEFSQYGDWLEKYELLIEYSKTLPVISETFKTEENLVAGCTSKVWLHAEVKDGNVFYSADSDAIITKGLVALVSRILSGHTPREIMDAELYSIKKIGLSEHLTPNRANGLQAMIRKMKEYAKSAGGND